MIPYENLAFLPSLIAETVCEREYKGQEWSPGMRLPNEIAKYEGLRKKMTPEQVKAFAEYVDQRCEQAYKAKAEWFMKIVRSRTNAGRDQLYMWVTHWMTSWLKTNIKGV
jgi:hypothetical protein